MLAPSKRSGLLFVSIVLAYCGESAEAQTFAKAGFLCCDVSAGIGLILVQKQHLKCVFTNQAGGPPEDYVGTITDYGVALGAVEKGISFGPC